MTLDRTSQWAMIVVAAVALFGALMFGASIFAPLTFGLVLGIVLAPVSDTVNRLGMPPTVGALISLLLTLTVIAALVLFFEPRVREAIDQAPRIMAEFQDLIRSVQGMLQGLDQVSESVEAAITEEAATPVPAPPAAVEGDVAAMVPQVSDALWLAPGIMAQLLIIMGAFFFFLLSRHNIYQWISRRRDGVSDGPTAKTLIEAERVVSRYFLTVTIINVGLGVVVAAGLMWIGLPSPYLWGIVVAIANFILYVGPLAAASGLLIAGVVTFDGPTSFLPPLIYIGANAIEGQFVTPALVGRSLSVNPLLVFLSLVFWLWLWGPLGGIVAIPLLLYVLAIVSGFGVSQSISFGSNRSGRNRSAGAGG